MASVNLGIVDFTYNVNFPTIDCEIDLIVPGNIPEVGGRRFKLESFSLSLENPTITIPVDLKLFGGSITVGLNTSRCEVELGGAVTLDVIVKKFHWTVGPAYIPYFKPLRLPEPTWSTNPMTIDAAKLQSAISAAPPSKSGSKRSIAVHNDAATQAMIRALFTFCGASTLVDDMLKSAGMLAANVASPAARAPGARPALAASPSGAVVIGFGVGASGGGGVGMLGDGGYFFTSDGDFGRYGSLGLGVGIIEGISAGATGFVYWPDAGQSAEDCFKGYNWFVLIEGGELATVNLTISWPCNSNDRIISGVPCGVAVGLGVGAGLPVNFLVGSSHTWTAMIPPGYAPVVPGG